MFSEVCFAGFLSRLSAQKQSKCLMIFRILSWLRVSVTQKTGWFIARNHLLVLQALLSTWVTIPTGWLFQITEYKLLKTTKLLSVTKIIKLAQNEEALPWTLTSLSVVLCNMFFLAGFTKSGTLAFSPYATLKRSLLYVYI